MSTLSQFSGGGIKSIQRGTLVGSASATITAVNTAKTMLNYCGNTGGMFSTDVNFSYLLLSSSTQVTAVARINAGTLPTVSYEVIEYF